MNFTRLAQRGLFACIFEPVVFTGGKRFPLGRRKDTLGIEVTVVLDSANLKHLFK